MKDLENISYMYPYGYEDELPRKAALVAQLASETTQRDKLFERTARPATDDVIHGLGWTALAAVTGGLATGRFENEAPIRTPSEKQIRALGGSSLNYLTLVEQTNTAVVNESAVLGYATSQAA
ncbi:MAG: hypothetical protein ABWX90_00100 [Candidatus Saccharimonadales bacterium]